MLKAKTQQPGCQASSGEDRASGKSQGTPGALASCGGDRWLSPHTLFRLSTPLLAHCWCPVQSVGSPWEKSELSKDQQEALSQQEVPGRLSKRTLELSGVRYGCCTHAVAR